MPLPPDLSKPIFALQPELGDRVLNGQCTLCAKPITEFANALSKKEYSISGMCQACQNDIFAPPEPEYDPMDGEGDPYYGAL